MGRALSTHDNMQRTTRNRNNTAGCTRPPSGRNEDVFDEPMERQDGRPSMVFGVLPVPSMVFRVLPVPSMVFRVLPSRVPRLLPVHCQRSSVRTRLIRRQTDLCGRGTPTAV